MPESWNNAGIWDVGAVRGVEVDNGVFVVDLAPAYVPKYTLSLFFSDAQIRRLLGLVRAASPEEDANDG